MAHHQHCLFSTFARHGSQKTMDAQRYVRITFAARWPVIVFPVPIPPFKFFGIFIGNTLFGKPIQNSKFFFADTVLKGEGWTILELPGHNFRGLNSAQIRRNKNTIEMKCLTKKSSRGFGLFLAERRQGNVHVAKAAAIFQLTRGSRKFLAHVALRLTVTNDHQVVHPFLFGAVHYRRLAFLEILYAIKSRHYTGAAWRNPVIVFGLWKDLNS